MTCPSSTSAHGTNPALTMTLMMMMMIVVPQAMAQPRLPDDTVVQTSGPERQAAPEDGFRLRVLDEMAEWRRKMQAFDERAETQGRRHIHSAEARLRDAWDDTEVEARNVQTATVRDWARTKRAYEAASHRMAVAWDKARL
jgi:hypothetical protein